MRKRGIVWCGALLVAFSVASISVAQPKEEGGLTGALDGPTAGIVKGKTRVFGWALDMTGGKVTEMELLVDGKTFQRLEYNEARSDVCEKFPNPNCPKIGFAAAVDFARATKGAHSISLQVKNDRKQKAEIGRRMIAVE